MAKCANWADSKFCDVVLVAVPRRSIGSEFSVGSSAKRMIDRAKRATFRMNHPLCSSARPAPLDFCWSDPTALRRIIGVSGKVKRHFAASLSSTDSFSSYTVSCFDSAVIPTRTASTYHTLTCLITFILQDVALRYAKSVVVKAGTERRMLIIYRDWCRLLCGRRIVLDLGCADVLRSLTAGYGKCTMVPHAWLALLTLADPLRYRPHINNWTAEDLRLFCEKRED